MEGTAAASGEAQNYIRHLEKENQRLQETNKKNIIQFEKRVAALERENSYLQEKLKLALFRQFVRHAENSPGKGRCRCLRPKNRRGPRRTRVLKQRPK
jgi:hypothetical protein